MRIDDAERLARQLMDQHGLNEWSLEFDNAKTRAGVCRSQRRQLGLSRPLTRLHDEAEVRDTILHEIAHALVGAHHHHDATWRATAIRIGCSGRRCISSASGSILADWVGTCPAGHRVTRHRRPQRVQSCGQCWPTFDPDALFEWTFRGHRAALPVRYLQEVDTLRARQQSLAAAITQQRDAADARVERPCGLPVGSTVVVLGSGRFAGAVGTIIRRARTRYPVRVPDGLITVPFGLVDGQPGQRG